MKHTPVYAVVLAAGKGTRMKSEKAKVLHEVFFKPMVHHVMDALNPLGISETVVVVGHQRTEVEDSLASFRPTFVVQDQQLGTGHAVLATKNILGGRGGTVFILCGDTPLIKSDTLQGMLNHHQQTEAAITLMTTELSDPTNYGRIISGPHGTVEQIVEEKDADDDQKVIQEVNAGIYCVDCKVLYEALGKVGTDNKQGEMYLTDIVEIANNSGLKVNKFICRDSMEILGVNSRVELAEAHATLQRQRNRELMLAGVTLYQPETISVEQTVSIGPDTVLLPNVTLRGKTTVGRGVHIDTSSLVTDCTIADGVRIGAFCCLTGLHLPAGTVIESHSVKNHID